MKNENQIGQSSDWRLSTALSPISASVFTPLSKDYMIRNEGQNDYIKLVVFLGTPLNVVYYATREQSELCSHESFFCGSRKWAPSFGSGSTEARV